MGLVKFTQIFGTFIGSASLALVLGGSAYAAEPVAYSNPGSSVETETKVTDSVVTDDSSATSMSVHTQRSNNTISSANLAEDGAIIKREGADSRVGGATQAPVLADVSASQGSEQPPLAPAEPLALPDNSKIAQGVGTAINSVNTLKILPPTRRVQGAWMDIQPTITNTHPAFIEDLASMLPSAPLSDNSSSKAPSVPGAQNTLLSRLTTILASSVMPVAFNAAEHFASATILELGLLVGAIVYVCLCSPRRARINFGTFVRMGGYAHAPRSDVASATSLTNFATPFQLSFVTANCLRVALS